MDYDAQTSV